MSTVLAHVPVYTQSIFVTTTVAEITIVPFINTKEIIFYNPNEDHRLLVKMMRASELAGNLTILGADVAMIVPVSGSLALALGPEGEREPFLRSTGANYQDQYTIYVQSETNALAATHLIQVTFIQCRGDLG